MAIGFLHTAAEHTATFDQLVVEYGGFGAERWHLVAPDLLADARDRGVDDESLQQRLVETLGGFPDGIDRILVTCSTLGGVAEQLAPPDGPVVTRVDRPMAEAAVAAGSRIGVAYSIASTVVPTSTLLWEVAESAHRSIDLDLIDCESAWKFFASGHSARYVQVVADKIRERAHDIDVVVLAQASLAGAAPLLADLDIPVLSSPGLAVERAFSS